MAVPAGRTRRPCGRSSSTSPGPAAGSTSRSSATSTTTTSWACSTCSGSCATRDRTVAAGTLPPIDGLWHNSFARAVGGADIEPKVRAVLRDGGRLGAAMPGVAGVLRGVGEGDALRAGALALGIPLDAGFPGGQVLVGLGQPHGLDPLRVTVVGPSRSILDRLRTQWLGWLARHPRPGVAADATRLDRRGPRPAASRTSPASSSSSSSAGAASCSPAMHAPTRSSTAWARRARWTVMAAATSRS